MSHKTKDINYSNNLNNINQSITDECEAQLTMDDVEMPIDMIDRTSQSEEDKEAQYKDERLGFLAGACDYEFGEEEMRILSDLILSSDIPDSVYGKRIAQYNFLLAKYHELQYQSSKRPIPHRFGYLKAIIQGN